MMVFSLEDGNGFTDRGDQSRSSKCRTTVKVKQSRYTPWRRFGGEEL
jgi:hypothetical protein